MVEHAENFLALYAVEMDAALEIQSPESWDSFPLFQLLNDFLRTDCELSRCERPAHSDPFVSPLCSTFTSMFSVSLSLSLINRSSVQWKVPQTPTGPLCSSGG